MENNKKSLNVPWSQARKRQSELQESRMGQMGKKQLNSGRTSWTSKRDAIMYGFLGEGRTTRKKSHSINVDELKDLRREASFSHALPAMHFNWELENENWVLITENDFIYREQLISNLIQQVKQLGGDDVVIDARGFTEDE